MVLTLTKITRIYGPRLIFKDVSLRLAPGTLTLLAGANGAGKSTLLQIMAGLIAPSAGEVRYKDTGKSPFSLAYLGHQTFIYPELTALENLAFWQRLSGRDAKRKTLEHALEQVDLLPFAEEKAGGFSRGMSQRLNLARVFLQQPDLLLLDEPGTGLDTRSAAQLNASVIDAKKRGCAVVWISHAVTQDQVHADSIALLEKKRLAYFGAPAGYPGLAHQKDGLPPTSEGLA